MPHWGQISLQDGASKLMVQIIQLHDKAILIIILVLTVIRFALLIIITNTQTNRLIQEHQKIETAWTIAPGILLLFLAIPSIRLLYLIDEVSLPSITLKAIGHQWYWRYEYSDFINVEIDCYIVATEDLNLGEFRLLETDNRIVVPIGLETRVLVTAADVIHSWTIPAFGVKVDAIPGRLNQVGFIISTPGVFYGQCSEICGVNHSFIPIAVEAVRPKAFTNFITKALTN